MTRVNIKTGTVIKKQEFLGSNPEKQLQQYIERFLPQFFQCYLLKSLHRIPGGEIDTLAITEDGVPCIIEYKHRKNDTILNQIVYYYDWLKERSTKFEFERISKENEQTKDLAIDWSRIRLICIAEEYTKWDISLIKHLDTDIECYSYSYHEEELDVHLDPIINQYKKPKPYLSFTNAQGSVPTLEELRNKSSPTGKELFDKLREKILGFGEDISEGYTPDYVKYVVTTTFAAIHFRKNWLIVQLRINESTFDDPKCLAKDISSRKWTVTREIKFDTLNELDYVSNLIRQAYDSQ